MRKVKLDPDALRVESFETHAAASGGGTVRGHQPSANSTNGMEVCLCYDSWNATCVKCRTDEETCADSCWGTCTCP